MALSEIAYPKGDPAGLVFLWSDGGYDAADSQLAQKLADAGAIVVGVDTVKTYAKIDANPPPDCVYIVGDVEEVSQEVQKRVSDRLYRNPIIAGEKTGGSIALALAAQTPDASVGSTVAVDPGATIPMKTRLCTEATGTFANGAWTFGMEEGRNPDPITIVYTPGADPAGRRHVQDIVAAGHVIAQQDSTEAPDAALVSAIVVELQKRREADAALLGDLPLSVLPAKAPSQTMAIVISGDGGWRDLDREVARRLAEEGVPTIGIDSLRYFWSEKPPPIIARDLERIVSVYGKMWNASRVALIGYSFGADVLPQTFPALPKPLQDEVVLISLLAPAGSAEYEFAVSGLVSGWFGITGEPAHPYLPDLKRLPQDRLQCFYGAEDADSVCKELAGTGAQVVETQGGHHFDGNYTALAEDILKRLQQP